MRIQNVIDAFSWKTPSTQEIILCDSDIHIWCLPLNIPNPIYHSIIPALSPEEFLRAKRFHFKKDYYSFVVRRALLRIIISYYTGIQPKTIVFCHNKHGKPSLYLEEGKNESVEFSVSSSHNFAVYAISRNRSVGIDIEKKQPIPEINSIVEHYFPQPYQALFSSEKPDNKLEVFFVLWTRMEAYLKAQGIGFSSLDSGQEDISKWRFLDFSPRPEYVASLAYFEKDAQILCFDWKKFHYLGNPPPKSGHPEAKSTGEISN